MFWQSRWIYVPAPPELSIAIQYRLEQEWFDKVQNAINEHLAEDREEAREAAYEARHPDRMHGFL